MNNLKLFFKKLYLNTYKQKAFRDILWYTRIVMLIILSLIIAFLSNLYIYTFMNQKIFIIAIIISCFLTYFLSFKIVSKEYQCHNRINITTRYPLIYVGIEATFVAIFFICLFLIIQSFYI